MSCVCAICGFRKDITPEFKQWPLIMGKSSEIYPITKNGNPNRELKGYICAKCLREASKMRVYIKDLLSGIKVTKHAVERFLLRNPGEKMDKETAKRVIKKLFNRAEQIRFKDVYMVERLLRNKVMPVDYYYSNGFIFVATQETPPTILTVELSMGKKLGKDFFYIENG